jgi:hypothetical protein
MKQAPPPRRRRRRQAPKPSAPRVLGWTVDASGVVVRVRRLVEVAR